MADNLADKEKRCLPNKKYLSGKNHLRYELVPVMGVGTMTVVTTNGF